MTASVEGLLRVFHVGSTAVSDLLAKPVVDVLAVYDDYEAASDAAKDLRAVGYDLQRDDSD